ncbi:MAG: hypothetical protein RL030_525 [Pseudomonadota bacterium]
MSLRVSQRGLAVGVVVVAHLGLLWLLAQIRLASREQASPYAVIHVLPIQHPPELTEPPRPDVRERTPRSPRIETPRPIAPPTESTAITLPPAGPPGVDWQREAQAVARLRAEPPVETLRSLDARPNVLTLPENPGHVPKKGDMTPMRPDGTIGVWTTDEIYCESRDLLMNHFEPWARSIPPHCYKRAKQRPKPSQEFDLP